MKYLTLFLLLIFSTLTFAQNKSTSPYVWDWTRDGIWTGAALAGTAGGVLIISQKDEYTPQEIINFQNNKDDINFADRWVAGNFSESASMTSDVPFYLSFAAPFALLLDDKMNDHAGQLFGIYIQSLATTGALFSITAGLSNRARPYVYNTTNEGAISKSKTVSATRSFYSGHVAATTTATFFAAKAFQDFNPDSNAVPYVWTAAILLPATVGYYRMEAGQHFLTDVLLGYGLGALAGYYIPELHKKKVDSNVSVTPIMRRDDFGENYQGFSLSYSF